MKHPLADLAEVNHWRREMGWRWRDMCVCRCCHQIAPRHAWMRWGRRIPLPVCTRCKYVGCCRCNGTDEYRRGWRAARRHRWRDLSEVELDHILASSEDYQQGYLDGLRWKMIP
jgi:hypothetical protein